jgi:hypothetical protein
MAKLRGHRTESDTEAEYHEARSRAGEDGNDGSYVGATGPEDAFDAGETGAEARSKRG